jgi:hypothetical protein
LSATIYLITGKDIHDPRDEWRVGIRSDKEHSNEGTEHQHPPSAVQKGDVQGCSRDLRLE